jgi:hypothetical protein
VAFGNGFAWCFLQLIAATVHDDGNELTLTITYPLKDAKVQFVFLTFIHFIYLFRRFTLKEQPMTAANRQGLHSVTVVCLCLYLSN